MAYEGELVRLMDGRWARFQACRVNGATSTTPLMVAVELDETHQARLDRRSPRRSPQRSPASPAPTDAVAVSPLDEAAAVTH